MYHTHIHLCAHTYTLVLTRAHTLVHTYSHTHIYSLAHTHTCALAHTHTHSCTHTLTHSHTHTLVHTRTHTYTLAHTHNAIHTRAYTHTHSHTHTYTRAHTYIHTRTHTHTYTYTLVHTHIHTRTHTHTYTYTLAHTHIHTRAHTYIHTRTHICARALTHGRHIIDILCVLTPCFNVVVIGTSPNSWTDQLQSVTINAFTSTVGPTTDIPESPIDVFELFFSEDLQEEIVRENYRYAKQVMGDQQYQSWTPITVEELKAFFGFSILMGVNHLPSLDDYWSRDQRLRYAPIADRIPRWCFREISRYLLFVDNDHLPPRGDPAHDRLGKVRPLITHLSNKFATLYEPSKEVAVDQAMINFQGHSSLK